MDNRKNGVKVISANENISEGSKGIILEYVLEGMAEYYSADLSEKVILPMIVLKCFDDILSPTLPEAIVKAYADIITAITNLERVGNKAALVAVIAKAEAIVAAKDSYVSSTLNGLEEALAAGKAVNDNPDALQDAINNAVTLLTEKVANVRLLGDVNNDGSVTTDDSALLLRSAAELDTLDDAATVSADMNQDGIADTSDAVLILQTAAEF